MFHKTGGNMQGAGSVKPEYKRKEELTLGDYVENITKNIPKKLTFDEWWSQLLPSWKKQYVVDKEAIYAVWKAAQENV